MVAALLAVAGVVACSPSDLADYDLGVDDGASEGDKQTLKVDGTGEAHLSLSTGAGLDFAKGAVNRSVEIGMERPADDKAITFVKKLKAPNAIASAPYILTPHGTEFKDRVTLELPAPKNPGRMHVVAYLQDESDSEWKLVGPAKIEGGKAKVDLRHFSVVILLDAEESQLLPADRTDAGTSATDAAVIDAGSATAEPDAYVGVVDAGATGPVDGAADASPVDPTPTQRDAAASADSGTTAAPDAAVSVQVDGAVTGVVEAGVADAAVDPNPGPDASTPDGGIFDAGAFLDASYDASTSAPPDAAFSFADGALKSF